MNKSYKKFIKKYGENKFLLLYSFFFANILVFIHFIIIIIIFEEKISLKKFSFVYIISICLGYLVGTKVVKNNK